MKEKRLFKVATPIIIELIFLMLYGTVDTLMLSNYSDNEAGSVGMSYVFAIVLGLGLLGVFIGFALDELTRGLLNMLKFKSKAWYEIKLT
jgi:Na+-driven multidrug efflux pump